MNVFKTAIPDLLIVEPKVFGDSRGCFFETYHRRNYSECGISLQFVQDNFSVSQAGVLRGLHFQNQYPQGKLVQVLLGEVFDVAVDVRIGSPYFGKWVAINLSEENRKQIYIPPGFAHGFMALSPKVHLSYKCTDFYYPQFDSGFAWNDPAIGIVWPVGQPILSEKDKKLPLLKDVPQERFQVFQA